MVTKLALVSISLPTPLLRHEIEDCLNLSFKKGIEKTIYAQNNGRYLIYTPFNVLTFINWEKREMIEALEKLGLNDAESYEQYTIYQDYPILIDANSELTCKVSNESITLKESSTLYLIIIALVISQSVGLEKYEQDLQLYFAQSKQLLDLTNNYTLFKRSKLINFTKQLTSIQHSMMSDLFLLDKPNILWDNEDAENLYNLLAAILELKDRFEIVQYKSTSLKEDVVLSLDLFNHKHSEFLEWIIIVLIAFEIVMGLIEFFKP
ncbi:MAG: RMD1 family protein [Sulfurospirillaceae bacterium]|nr:RMD1 family protein [Sulfurospirillaceae bacterium]